MNLSRFTNWGCNIKIYEVALSCICEQWKIRSANMNGWMKHWKKWRKVRNIAYMYKSCLVQVSWIAHCSASHKILIQKINLLQQDKCWSENRIGRKYMRHPYLATWLSNLKKLLLCLALIWTEKARIIKAKLPRNSLHHSFFLWTGTWTEY